MSTTPVAVQLVECERSDVATQKVRLTKEKETMLISLYARALHSRSENPVLRGQSKQSIMWTMTLNRSNSQDRTACDRHPCEAVRRLDVRVDRGQPGIDRASPRMRTGQPRVPRGPTLDGAFGRKGRFVPHEVRTGCFNS